MGVCAHVCVCACACLLHHFSKENRFSLPLGGESLVQWPSTRFSGCLSESVSCSIVNLLFVTPWTVARQVSPSMEFSRHKYWSGSSFPSPGDLPDPGIEHRSPALQADSLPSEPLGKPWCLRGKLKDSVHAGVLVPHTPSSPALCNLVLCPARLPSMPFRFIYVSGYPLMDSFIHPSIEYL